MNKILDLGMHPFADMFIKEDQLNFSEPVYPLECFLNENTGEIRLGCETKPDERYSLYDYSYTSSNSNFSRGHWSSYAKNVVDFLKLPKGSLVVEIGSNDGFLTKQFIECGFESFGVDASPYMCSLAEKNGVQTYNKIFNNETALELKADIGSVNLIVANNVFNHANDAYDFSLGVSNLLSDDGVFVYELPYWYNTIRDGKFDQVYHEHVTYFTAKFSYELMKSVGLEIFHIEVANYHGGSLRVFARKSSDVQMQLITKEFIDKETKFGLFDPKTYVIFQRQLLEKRNKFLGKIYDIKEKGYSIIGVGAAAKGNTFLNYYNLDKTVLDYVTDISEHKQGKYTPLTRIPIVSDEIFSNYDKVYALILSWNISDILKTSLSKINSNIEFISLPELK
jgi:SAM-dependent methyltransferase